MDLSHTQKESPHLEFLCTESLTLNSSVCPCFHPGNLQEKVPGPPGALADDSLGSAPMLVHPPTQPCPQPPTACPCHNPAPILLLQLAPVSMETGCLGSCGMTGYAAVPRMVLGASHRRCGLYPARQETWLRCCVPTSCPGSTGALAVPILESNPSKLSEAWRPHPSIPCGTTELRISGTPWSSFLVTSVELNANCVITLTPRHHPTSKYY